MVPFVTWRLCLGLCFVLQSAGFLVAATYYIDSDLGSDSKSGLSPINAWQSLSRANQQTFSPGDSILLARGCIWQGTGFKAHGNGTATAPITLADYGPTDRPLPLIDGVGEHEPAVLLQNVRHWRVRNLELTQHGQAPQALDTNNEKGKDFDQYSDEYMRAVVHILGLGPSDDPNCGEGCTVRDIVLENLVVHDGSWTGIYASGGYYQLRTATYGFLDGLTISGVESYNNHKAGIEVTCTYYKTRTYAASNIYVLNSRLHHNGGDGVMMGPVYNGLIDGNVCSYNGRIRNARVGAWTWDSENTVIQFNESHHNMTPLIDGKARDGAGFDLDLGTENGLLQYNWSHDNQGEGFLLLSWPIGFGYERGTSHNIQMRYNVSERDGKKLAGSISIFGGVAPAVVYNNLIYYEPDRPVGTDMFNGEGGAVTTSIWGKSGKPDARFYNNIFITNGRTNRAAASNNLWSDGAGTFVFENNIWWRVEGGVQFAWGGTTLANWADWRALGFEAQGMNTNPQVSGVLGSSPAAYRLSANSPAIDTGRMVTDAPAGMGLQDYFGNTIAAGAGYDIGAAEYRVGTDPAKPAITSVQPQNGIWRVMFSGLPGRNYSVEGSGDLKAWTSPLQVTEQSPGVYLAEEKASLPYRFYRSRVRSLAR